MTSNPDPVWRTNTVAIRPWAATLGQHGLPQVVTGRGGELNWG
jgi:hypothetical protein